MDDKFFLNLMPGEDGYDLDLHTSASIGCDERVRDIIENAENKRILNQQNKCGWTPLMYAACSTNLKILLFLLEEGAIPDLRNNFGQTALIIASKCGSADTVSLLIEFKANINVKDSKGWSAIFYASAFGHRSVVQLLSDKGAIANIVEKNDGLTPLMLAAAAGHEMIVKDLLLCGLDPSFESKSGDTARSLAIKYGHQNVKNLIDTYFQSKKTYNCATQKNLNYGSELDLITVLNELHLSKYYYLFEKQAIDLNAFWMLTDEDLKEIGINLLGPRKKICLAISRHQSNQADYDLVDANMFAKLSLENKRLLQKIEKLEMELLHEKDARMMSEKKLNDGVLTLKSFTNNIQHCIQYTLALEEKLKQNHSDLKKCLSYNHDIKNELFKKDYIFPILEGSERLINEIHHQNLLCLQQTDVRY